MEKIISLKLDVLKTAEKAIFDAESSGRPTEYLILARNRIQSEMVALSAPPPDLTQTIQIETPTNPPVQEPEHT